MSTVSIDYCKNSVPIDYAKSTIPSEPPHWLSMADVRSDARSDPVFWTWSWSLIYVCVFWSLLWGWVVMAKYWCILSSANRVSLWVGTFLLSHTQNLFCVWVCFGHFLRRRVLFLPQSIGVCYSINVFGSLSPLFPLFTLSPISLLWSERSMNSERPLCLTNA